MLSAAISLMTTDSINANVLCSETTPELLPLWQDSIAAAVRRPDWEDCFAALMAVTDDAGEVEWESMHDVLADLAVHPININTAGQEDFEQFPFLTAHQIEELSEYLCRYGPMRTMGELRLIESLDYMRRQLLQCFLYVGPPDPGRRPSLGEMLSRGRTTLMATAKLPFYDRKGDADGYLGYK